MHNATRWIAFLHYLTLAIDLRHDMNTFSALTIALIAFVILLLVFWALSSCLGDEIRAHLSGGRTTQPTTYGLQYARMMDNGGMSSGWEHIEMDDMMDRRLQDED